MRSARGASIWCSVVGVGEGGDVVEFEIGLGLTSGFEVTIRDLPSGWMRLSVWMELTLVLTITLQYIEEGVKDPGISLYVYRCFE